MDDNQWWLYLSLLVCVALAIRIAYGLGRDKERIELRGWVFGEIATANLDLKNQVVILERSRNELAKQLQIRREEREARIDAMLERDWPHLAEERRKAQRK